MEIERLKKCNRALGIINGHFNCIAEELTEEVITNEESFYLGSFGKGDAILEKYQHPLYRVELAKCALLQASRQILRDIEMKNKDVHLKKDEFLCLSCRNIINRHDKECSECGWTWEV
jgi:hypothetical protein